MVIRDHEKNCALDAQVANPIFRNTRTTILQLTTSKTGIHTATSTNPVLRVGGIPRWALTMRQFTMVSLTFFFVSILVLMSYTQSEPTVGVL